MPSPSSAALPAAVPHRPCRRAPPHPPPPQHPARRRMAAASSAVAPQSRRRASDTTLRRRACASPTLSMRALPARAPCGRRLNTPFEPAGGSSYRPRPLQRGAQQRHHRWLYGCTPVIAGRSRRPSHFSQSPDGDAPARMAGSRMAGFGDGWQDCQCLQIVPPRVRALAPRVPRCIPTLKQRYTTD